MAFGPDGNLYVGYDDKRIFFFDGDDGRPLGLFVDKNSLLQMGGMAFVPEPAGVTIALGTASLLLHRRRHRRPA